MPPRIPKRGRRQFFVYPSVCECWGAHQLITARGVPRGRPQLENISDSCASRVEELFRPGAVEEGSQPVQPAQVTMPSASASERYTVIIRASRSARPVPRQVPMVEVVSSASTGSQDPLRDARAWHVLGVAGRQANVDAHD